MSLAAPPSTAPVAPVAPVATGDCASEGLIPWEAALARILATTEALPVERIAASQALGRVPSEDVRARWARPAREASAMDGYAVSETDPPSGARWRLIGRAWAAAPFAGPLRAGEAVRVTTGAPLPCGARRVIVDEAVTLDDGEVRLTSPLANKTNIRAAGSDFAGGTALARSGAPLTGPALMALAAGGVESLAVHRRPRLAILAIGDELAQDGPHRIPDSATPGVGALAQAWGGQIVSTERLVDDAAQIARALDAALATADVAVTIGGASGSERDLTRAAAARLGGRTLFAGVALKPGKPAWAAQLRGRLVLGLPGNPVAAMVAARLLLAPLLAQLEGRPEKAALRWRQGRCEDPLAAAGDRETMALAQVQEDGALRLLPRQDSASHAALAWLDALIRRRAGAAASPAGAMVEHLSL